MQIKLPNSDRQVTSYSLSHKEAREVIRGDAPQSRVVYSAAHIVCDPLADISPVDSTCLDWEATMTFRHHLWSLGLQIAEAMDTAQRGSGLDWKSAKDLIQRSLKEARSVGGGIACGAGTEQLSASNAALHAVRSAYLEQCEFVESHGGQIILMASRALARCARGPDDYRQVYGAVLTQTSRPVILHWLGEAFDPTLAGYWGAADISEAMQVCLSIIEEYCYGPAGDVAHWRQELDGTLPRAGVEAPPLPEGASSQHTSERK